jgi:hypothetical protein
MPPKSRGSGGRAPRGQSPGGSAARSGRPPRDGSRRHGLQYIRESVSMAAPRGGRGRLISRQQGRSVGVPPEGSSGGTTPGHSRSVRDPLASVARRPGGPRGLRGRQAGGPVDLGEARPGLRSSPCRPVAPGLTPARSLHPGELHARQFRPGVAIRLVVLEHRVGHRHQLPRRGRDRHLTSLPPGEATGGGPQGAGVAGDVLRRLPSAAVGSARSPPR